ncbi:hypothetical protein VCEDC022_003428A, partial [Vibrio cholerae O1 str. EDC-022]
MGVFRARCVKRGKY